jgi:organic radical activating enzyme
MTKKDISEPSVKLIEVFNTWQGEGVDTGSSMLILRFKACNLKCSWCDTRVKMRIIPEAEYSLSQLQGIIDENKCGILVTGGEPTIPKHIDDCRLLLNKLKYPIANVESNGYNLRELIMTTFSGKNIKYIYSPKIFSNEDLRDTFVKTERILKVHPRLYIKIVYEQNELIDKFLGWLTDKNINQQVYLMPEGTNRADLIRNAEKVFDACEKYKFNFSSRTHIIYGFV